ncbi:MAG TPA: proteasome subunit beta [Candidatus Caldiarchaeum subterraneum]|uniref:Proteasome subunit beta n=1 Tax=Caldiarchaeum subterraneum TaxID=311458 RepID=A0A833E9S0_CALS0|nr:proteasome subunit beta [Aigarchaeota archaeon]HIQ29025.1 proteasome subunit beta [Candidatus Caldarchaeum subterraneum]
MAQQIYLPGATTVGIVGKDCVALASEKRFAYGYFVISKAARKVFPITRRIGAACAGVVGDMQNLIKETTAVVNLYRIENGREPSVQTVAKLLSWHLFSSRFFPYFTETIVGGLDEGGPHVIVLDPLGSMIEDDYAVVGTGAEIAVGVIENEYSRNLGPDEVYNLAIKAVRSSISRDAGSGNGVDILLYTNDGLVKYETLPP